MAVLVSQETVGLRVSAHFTRHYYSRNELQCYLRVSLLQTPRLHAFSIQTFAELSS